MSRWESTHPHRPWHHFFYFFGKISGIFHYFNESFVIDPLNDFERHFSWLSKTSLLLKIGQSPWKLCMVEYLSFSVWFWDFTNLSFPTVFVAVDPLPLATKGFAAKPSLIWRRVGFLYLRFLTIQLQAHPPTVDAHELHRVALTRHLNEILRGVAF